jgi:hypothetical protein
MTSQINGRLRRVLAPSWTIEAEDGQERHSECGIMPFIVQAYYIYVVEARRNA